MECNNIGTIVAAYIIDYRDMKTDKDGKMTMKRKYGKFKRHVHKFNLKK